MNHLNHCVHRWHCALGSHKDNLLLCSNGIKSQDINQLYLRILNTVACRDPENGTLAVGQSQGYMPHKHAWEKFKVPFFIIVCLDYQFRSGSFNLQQLTLSIWFTGHSSMAYNKWEWKIDHSLIKSTRHSLLSLRWWSTIVCWCGIQASLGSRQGLVQEV